MLCEANPFFTLDLGPALSSLLACGSELTNQNSMACCVQILFPRIVGHDNIGASGGRHDREGSDTQPNRTVLFRFFVFKTGLPLVEKRGFKLPICRARLP